MAERDFLIWFTGFFDGEGNISIRKSGINKLAVRLSASQTEGNNGESVCKAIQRNLGGSVRSDIKSDSDGHKRQILWTWSLSSRFDIKDLLQESSRFDIKDLLQEMLPYMLVKKEQAEVAVEIINDITIVRMADWSDSDTNFIRDNYMTMQYAEIAKALHRGVKTTRNYIHTLGLPTKIRREVA